MASSRGLHKGGVQPCPELTREGGSTLPGTHKGGGFNPTVGHQYYFVAVQIHEFLVLQNWWHLYLAVFLQCLVHSEILSLMLRCCFLCHLLHHLHLMRVKLCEGVSTCRSVPRFCCVVRGLPRITCPCIRVLVCH